MNYEYMVVRLEMGPGKTREAELTKRVNAVAEHGWRLTSVASDGGSMGSGMFAFFERAKS